MKILIVSDAWLPQINGVVRTIQASQRELEKAGHSVLVVGPDLSRNLTFSMPTYKEISIELFAGKRLESILDTFKPDTIHVATEGPLGWSMRRLCLRRGYAFTTAYHTRFPEYLALRFLPWLSPFVSWLAYQVLRHFHRPSSCVMVPTSSLATLLQKHGFRNVALWSRGVDTEVFVPSGKSFEPFCDLKRPILLYVGRVSAEKNLPAFLECRSEGTKVVIGSGPDLDRFIAAYPQTVFLGSLEKQTLAQAYSSADLFVFPSKSDTFGLVLLEACAAGLRIAAYPVLGPIDIFDQPDSDSFVCLNDDLGVAIEQALKLPDSKIQPRRFAENRSWAVATRQFEANLRPLTLENPKIQPKS